MVENLNPLFLKKCIIQNIHSAYNKLDLTDVLNNDIKILHSPFKTVQIFNFFQNKEFVKNLASEIKNIKLKEISNDLYKLQQSQDLKNVDLGDNCKKFISLMETKVLQTFSHIFGVKLNRDISMTVSKYKQGDYLLCHDDKCEKRHLAFVLYLSDTNWKTNDGGLLSLFNHDEETKQPVSEEVQLLPTFNSMVLFEVNTTTYHQVTEVLSRKLRWSINGWFHSKEALNIPNVDYHYISGQVLSVEGENLKYDHVINKNYTKSTITKKICSQFKDNKSVSLATFLENNFYSSCLNELKSEIKWKEMGPANHRKYYTAEFSLDELDRNLPTNLRSLVSILCSPNFATYISSITKVRLVQDDGNSRNPINIEIQKWTKGCYTLLADNDVFQSLNFMDVILFFTPETVCNGSNGLGGALCYVHDLEGERILIPASNVLIISDFDENTKKFTRYIDSKSRDEHFYAVALSFLVEKIEIQ